MAQRYGQYCPIALATEILGERWTLLIVVVLMDGFSRFADLQRGLPRISPSVLSSRLRSLIDAGVVRKQPGGGSGGSEYFLTEAGQALAPIVMELGAWGQRWARDLEIDDLDPLFLAWSVHQRIDTQGLPPGRSVIEFEFSHEREEYARFWIVIDDGEVDVCIKHPGFEIDLRVVSDLRRFVDIWRGFRSLEREIAARRVRLEGSRELKRLFPKSLLLSMLAPVPRLRPGRERTLSRRTARGVP